MTIVQGPFWERLWRMVGDGFVFPEMDCQIAVPEKYHFLFPGKLVDGKVVFGDVLTVIDHVLLRREENGNVPQDKFGRFARNRSLFVNNGYDQSPFIDELLVDIANQLKLETKPVWPDGKKATVCLTHDVDHFDGRSYLALRKMWWSYQVCAFLVNGRKEISREYVAKILRWSDPYYDPVYAFNNWMALEDEYGFRSTFFFFGLRHALSREGRLYSFRNKRVRQTIRRLDKNGWEIGLHAGYYHNLELDSLRKQKMNLEDALGKKISGCRQHFLRVRFPESWELYEDAGFAYSTNMAWGGGGQGFRAGTCFPYRPLAGRALMEIPFQLMDMASIEKPAEYHSLFLDYLQKVKKVGGCLVINFHQEYFDEIEAPGTNEAYRMILETLAQDKGVWVARIEDVVNYLK